MNLDESDLEQYFLIKEYGKEIVARFIGKDNTGDLIDYLFEVFTKSGDFDGDGSSFKLSFGRYGKYDCCKYKDRKNVIRKLSEKEALAYLI
ncbi:MAG: hypothetical protein IMZ52_02290 [Actinobacteria bacterium]|nr:hypothetical protein [Actinomycetota bacterium]MBE3114852.1 hypothetical protein [Actinomycetota bacterium]